MLSSYALLSLALFPNPTQEPQTSVALSVNLSSLSYAENNSIYDLIEGNESNYQTGESAFSFNEVSLGMNIQNVTVSLFQRYEWFTKYSGDTMDLYGRTTNGLDLENLRHYQIDLSAQHFNASGLRLGYTQSLGQFAFYAAGSLLSGSDMMAGTISGDALLNSACGDSFDCYTGDLELDYFYSEDAIFGRKTSKPRSVYGYTFDVGASWTNERWHVSGFIQDVFSEIAWENAPYTTANATTATVEEKNGKVKLNPVITGYEGNDYFLQSLPKKYSSTIAFAVTPRSTVHIDGFHSYGATVGNIGYLFAKHQMLWGAKYYPLQQVLGASIAHKYFSISAAANPFDLNSSEIIELSASFRYPF